MLNFVILGTIDYALNLTHAAGQGDSVTSVILAVGYFLRAPVVWLLVKSLLN